PAAGRRISKSPGLRGRRVQARQEAAVGDDHDLWQLAPSLEPHLLALVEALRLTDLPVRPDARSSAARADLHSLVHEGNRRGIAGRGLPVEVVRRPFALHA